MMATRPTFSVVVPTHNRPRALAMCLEALAQQRYDRFEVIVVDDGGDVRPDATVNRFRPRLDVTLLRQANAGPGAARNTGVAQACGAYLAFTDDDCTPAPDWLARLAASAEAHRGALIGGRVVNALPANPYATASQLLTEYLYAYYAGHPRHRFFTTNNMAVPRTTFQALGGFDTTYIKATSEDRELCDRWQHYGHPMHYAADAVVYHAHPLTLRRFWRQHFNYGRGAPNYHRARAARGLPPFEVEPPSFYRDLLGYPLGRFPAGPALRQVLLLGVAQAATAAGMLWELLQAALREEPDA